MPGDPVSPVACASVLLDFVFDDSEFYGHSQTVGIFWGILTRIFHM